MVRVSKTELQSILKFSTPLEEVKLRFPDPFHPQGAAYTVAFTPMRNELGMVDTFKPLKDAIRKKELRTLGPLQACFGAPPAPSRADIAQAAHRVGNSLQGVVLDPHAAPMRDALIAYLNAKNKR